MNLRTDREVTRLIDPLVEIFQQIEFNIITDIGEALANYDNTTGILEWHLKKLNEYQDINRAIIKRFSEQSGKTEKEIIKLLKEAQTLNIPIDDLSKAYNQGIIAVDPVKAMQSLALQEIATLSYIDLTNTFKLIQTKAIDSSRKAYMNIVNTAYVEVASGAYSLQESVIRGLKAFAKKGITTASYERKDYEGRSHIVNYSLEGTIRRDVTSAVHRLANESSLKLCQELGSDYVEVSSHLGARVNLLNPIANHAGWQGKIYKINGADEKYPNLIDKTGYGTIEGLGGVNCRHRMFPFVIGFSKPNPIRYGDTEENKRIYQAEQKQRAMERDIRALKKEISALKPFGNTEALDVAKTKLKRKQAEIQAHCNRYDIPRQYDRELVQEQLVK